MKRFCKDNGDGSFSAPDVQPNKILVNGVMKRKRHTYQWPDQVMFDAGYRLYVSPVFDNHTQKLGTIIDLGNNQAGHTVVAKDVDDLAAELASNILRLDQAARAFIDQAAHFTSLVMITDKAKAAKPKSLAVQTWTESVWAWFYTKKAELEAGAPLTEDMLDFETNVGNCPHSMKEIMDEV